MITKARDNKIILSENTLIFEQSGVKIITGIPEAELGETIRDMAINPGDTVVTTEGSVNVMKADLTFTDIAAAASGGVTKTKYTFDYTDFTSLPGNSAELPLFTLPSKAVLTETVIHETTQFTNGTGDTTTVFVSTEALAIALSSQILGQGTTFSRNNEGPMATDNSVLLSVTASTGIFINIDSIGGTGGLADLTAGSFDVYIEYKLLAE